MLCRRVSSSHGCFIVFFNDTATTEIYTLSLHDALPIFSGDWDGSLAAADALARVPDMAAHVRADGLLVLVGRGDPEVRSRLAWAQGLASRWGSHVLLMLATVAAEVELAAAEGDARTAADRARWADRRLQELWGEDRLATVRLVATALSAVADAAASARLTGNSAAVA